MADAPAENGNEVAVSELESKIIEQIEYYFGDINLARDKFLQGEIKKDEGWVELSTMLKFARLAKMTSDPKVIVAALKKSKNNLVEVNEDGTKIRRSPEKVLPTFDGEFVKDLISQSLYMKYIPKDATLDDVKEFLKKNAGDVKVNNVIMRTYMDKLTNEKKFKGSIFVTFDNKESAEKFLAEIKEKKLKFNDSCEENLIIKWQSEYHEEKKQEVRAKREKPNKGGGGDAAEGEDKKDIKLISELPTGALLKVTDIKDEVSREDIREYLEKIQSEEQVIDFIEFNVGEPTAFIRYKSENSAAVVAKLLEEKDIEIKGVKVKVELLAGEEEQTVLDRMKMDIFKRKQKLMNEKKSGRKFGGKRGGRGQKRRGGGRDFESKRIKVE